MLSNKFLVFLSVITLYTSILYAQKANKEQNFQDSILITRLIENKRTDSLIKIFSKKIEQYEISHYCYSNLIYSYFYENDIVNALITAEKWESNAKRDRDTNKIIGANNYKMKALYELNQTEEALQTCNYLYSIFRPKDSLKKSRTQLTHGLLLYHKNDFRKADSIYMKIDFEHIRQLGFDDEYYNNYALILSAIGKIDASIIFQKKSLEHSKQIDNKEGILLNLSNIASSYYDKKDYRKALTYIDSTKYITNIDKTNSVYRLIYENYFRIYEKLRNFDSAFVYINKLKTLNETITNKRLETEINELKSANNREINLINSIAINKENIAKLEREQLVSLIFFLVVILISGFIIFSLRINSIQKTNKTIVIEQKLLRTQMTPHFIFNSLSVIQGMILNNENNKANTYLSKFSRLMRLILENSRDKLVSIEDEMTAIEYYLELQSLQFNKSLRWEIKKTGNFDEEIFIPPMIIQPFVENSIKHGFRQIQENCEIIIELEKKEKYLICRIIDNGIGIDNSIQNKTKKSLSTSIAVESLKLLAKQLKSSSSLKIEDKKIYNQQGTIVTIQIPVKHKDDGKSLNS